MTGHHASWFKFYPADFMNGVRGLSAQEVGLYTMLLARIYEENGPVEYHPLRLSTYCGMREATFVKTLEKLLALGKITLRDGMLSNGRAEEEISNRSHDLKNASKAGKASAEKRQQNQRQDATRVQQAFNHTDTDTDTDKRVVVVSAQARDDAELTYREKLLHAAGIDPRKTITPGPKAPGSELDMIEARKWLNDSRFGGEDEIVQMVASIRSGMRDPPSTLRYFTKPLLAFATAKTASLPASPSEVTHDRQPARDHREAAAADRLRREIDVAARMRRPSKGDMP